MNVHKISFIIKVRGGLLDLNANVWKKGGKRKCLLCNLEEEENVLHFLRACLILGDVRIMYVGQRFITREKGINVMNEWRGLGQFV